MDDNKYFFLEEWRKKNWKQSTTGEEEPLEQLL